jgi:hypothetical protein
MRRSRRNASVLILTYLIQKLVESRMTHLFWCVGWIKVFFRKRYGYKLSPDQFSPAPPAISVDLFSSWVLPPLSLPVLFSAPGQLNGSFSLLAAAREAWR